MVRFTLQTASSCPSTRDTETVLPWHNANFGLDDRNFHLRCAGIVARNANYTGRLADFDGDCNGAFGKNSPLTEILFFVFFCQRERRPARRRFNRKTYLTIPRYSSRVFEERFPRRRVTRHA